MNKILANPPDPRTALEMPSSQGQPAVRNQIWQDWFDKLRRAVTQGLTVAAGSGTIGTSVMSGGIVTVPTPRVTVDSLIFYTVTNASNQGFLQTSSRIQGTSFTITSSNASDASNVAWVIIEPGA